jgi:hypothetical protein
VNITDVLFFLLSLQEPDYCSRESVKNKRFPSKLSRKV